MSTEGWSVKGRKSAAMCLYFKPRVSGGPGAVLLSARRRAQFAKLFHLFALPGEDAHAIPARRVFARQFRPEAAARL